MKFSIVVPVYNAEKYLRECIESVLNQTNPNWELILVDDGSTDGSGQLCDAFAERYEDKIFVYNKENEGQFLTRQYGIAKCTGDYIGFLDADDILSNDYVNTIAKCVGENKEPDVVCFAFSRFGGAANKDYMLPIDGESELFEELSERKEVYKHIINGDLTGSMSSKVFARHVLLNQKYDEKDVSVKRFAEDAFQSFSVIATVDSICYLNRKLYLYRENFNGASEGFQDRVLGYFNEKYVYELIKNHLSHWGMATEEYISMLYARNFNATVNYMLKYYRAAKTKKRRRQIVEYNWVEYLLPEVLKNLDSNRYVRQSYLKVWKAFSYKKHTEIYIREKFKKIIGW